MSEDNMDNRMDDVEDQDAVSDDEDQIAAEDAEHFVGKLVTDDNKRYRYEGDDVQGLHLAHLHAYSRMFTAALPDQVTADIDTASMAYAYSQVLLREDFSSTPHHQKLSLDLPIPRYAPGIVEENNGPAEQSDDVDEAVDIEELPRYGW